MVGHPDIVHKILHDVKQKATFIAAISNLVPGNSLSLELIDSYEADDEFAEIIGDSEEPFELPCCNRRMCIRIEIAVSHCTF